MDRNRFVTPLRLAAIAVVLVTSGVALADDNSMSPLTGDSYAYFNGLDFSPGTFNVAHVAGSSPQVATTPARTAVPPPAADGPTMLAARPALGPSKTFDDGTGA